MQQVLSDMGELVDDGEFEKVGQNLSGDKGRHVDN